MTIDQVLGILAILIAYGFTWYLLLKSKKIVKIISKEGLKQIGNIEERLKESGKENNE